MMSGLEVGLVAFLSMFGSYWIGGATQRFLRADHRSRETIDSVRLIITLLVTFAAIVVGMATSASQARFSNVAFVLRGLSTDITALDQTLREYGTDVNPLRAELILYTKVALADLWPEEPAPDGDYALRIPLKTGVTENHALGVLLNQIDLAILKLVPTDALHRSLVANLRAKMNSLLLQRWTLVTNGGSALPGSFVVLQFFWLAIIFLIAGISSPQNILVAAVAGFAALSLASSIFLALELDTPLAGYIKISSAPLRGALQHITEPPLPPNAP